MTIPLYFRSDSPCVQCAFCCKKGPCQYGEITSSNNFACRYLTQTSKPGHPTYDCGLYEQIVGHPNAHHSPAFGAGCCCPLFNTDRNAILAEGNHPHVSTVWTDRAHDQRRCAATGSVAGSKPVPEVGGG